MTEAEIDEVEFAMEHKRLHQVNALKAKIGAALLAQYGEGLSTGELVDRAVSSLEHRLRDQMSHLDHRFDDVLKAAAGVHTKVLPQHHGRLVERRTGVTDALDVNETIMLASQLSKKQRRRVFRERRGGRKPRPAQKAQNAPMKPLDA
jgi:hypothetical protein